LIVVYIPKLSEFDWASFHDIPIKIMPRFLQPTISGKGSENCLLLKSREKGVKISFKSWRFDEGLYEIINVMN